MKNSTKSRTTSFIIRLTFILTLLWSLSFQSFASEESSLEDQEPTATQTNSAIVSASAVNSSTNESFDATEENFVTIIVHPGEDNTFTINFHCNLQTTSDAVLNYHLFAIQTDDAIYLSYEDDLGNSFFPDFIFASEQEDDSVELCIDEDAEIFLNNQNMDLNFWENLTSSNGYDGIIQVGDSSVSLVFTVKASVNDETLSPDDSSAETTDSSNDQDESRPTEASEDDNEVVEDIELIDLTDDDIILDLSFIQNSDKAKRAEIEENQTDTIIKLADSADFTLRTKYYALPEFCNPVDCNTHIETTEDSFTVYFETALGEVRSHTYRFQPLSSEVRGITLSYNVSTFDYNLNISDPFGGLSAEECLFGRRGISDQVCYDAADIKVRITAKVAQPATSPNASSATDQSIDEDSADITKIDSDKTSIESDTKRSGLSIFIPTWLLIAILLITIAVVIYIAGEHKVLRKHFIPTIINIINQRRHPSNQTKESPNEGAANESRKP